MAIDFVQHMDKVRATAIKLKLAHEDASDNACVDVLCSAAEAAVEKKLVKTLAQKKK